MSSVGDESVNEMQALFREAQARYEAGDLAAARAQFERAVAAQPDFDKAWRVLALISFEMGDMDGAVAALQKLCKLTPDDDEAHTWLGDLLQNQNRCADAVRSYEHALTLDPESADLWAKMSRALLWEGRWDAALAATDKAIGIQPGHTGALALRSVALAEQGLEPERAALVDFDRLIQAFDVAVPAGFADMAAFNRALSTFCVEHPTLTFNPADNTTREGSQTGNFSGDAVTGPLRDLRAAIDECARAYAQQHPPEAGHPFLGQRPQDWTVVIWGTVLERHGHQEPHIHRASWLSGVYYAEVPDTLRKTGDDRSGWIEFGCPQFYPKATATPSVRLYPPVPGRLYMFPSYFYHRTIPFDADVRRVSIAFDLIPYRAP